MAGIKLGFSVILKLEATMNTELHFFLYKFTCLKMFKECDNEVGDYAEVENIV